MKRLFIILLLIIIAQINISAREFLNTILHINFGVSYGSLSGDIINEENSYTITYDTIDHKPAIYDTGLALTIDLAPFDPILIANDLQAIKFGVRTAIRYHDYTQHLTVPISNLEDKEYSGSLASFTTYMIGPVIHYAPTVGTSIFTGEYTAGGGFTFYALYGKLSGANLTAFPSKREKEGDSSVTTFESALSGSKFDIGMGAEISICSINLGVNLYYSQINLEIATNPYTNVSRSTKINETTMEIYVGIPLELTEFHQIF